MAGCARRCFPAGAAGFGARLLVAVVLCADAAALATQIIQLLADSQLKHGVGLLAAKHAREKFDLDRQVDAYLDWYHELLRIKR